MRRFAVAVFGLVIAIGPLLLLLFMVDNTRSAAATMNRVQVDQNAPITVPTSSYRAADNPSLAELLAESPDLKTYLDKIKGLSADKLDLGELYVNTIALYKVKGAVAVGIFLRDSGLLDTLHIPQGYLDLLTVFDQSGLSGLYNAVRQRQIINNYNELSSLILIDSDDNLDTVRVTLQTFGLSTYGFHADRRELTIGIPLDVLTQFDSVNGLLRYLSAIAKTPHIVGFRLPPPQLLPTPLP